MTGKKIIFIVLGCVGGLTVLWFLFLVSLALWGVMAGLSAGAMRKAAEQHKAVERGKALTTTGIPVVSEPKWDGTILPLTQLDEEAAEQGVERWKLTKLGDSHYVQTTSDTAKTVVELRNPKVKVSAESLTEADKLNGKQWRGRITLCSDATRTYSPKKRRNPLGGVEPPDTTWTQWGTNLEIPAKYEKANGRWSVDDAASVTKSSFETVEPSDLPK
jgi:hypothetical protein